MQRRLLACSAAAGFAAAALLIVGILGPAVVDRALDKAVDEYTIIDGPSAGAFKTFKHDDTKYRDFYMLNVTNPEEVVAGALPRLREVGPFRYVWHEQHLNITWQPEQDTLTSYVRTYYTFVSAPEGMTEHTRFTVPNLPFYAVYHNAMAQTDFTYRMIMLAMLRQALNDTLGMDDQRIMFDQLSPAQLMFGYDSPLLRYLSDMTSVFPAAFPGLTPNATTPQHAYDKGLYVERVGRADRSAIGQLVQAMGSNVTSYCPQLPCPPHEKQPTWATAEASRVNGTCGSRFGQRLQRCSTVSVFVDSFARSLPFANDRCATAEFRGVELIAYRIPDYAWANASMNPLNAQFFMHGASGLINMTTAVKLLPIFASKPHFLDASPALQAAMLPMGLRPDPRKHDSQLQVEPRTGLTMYIHVRLQFSLMVSAPYAVADSTVLAHAWSGLVPFMWMDINAEATQEQADELRGKMEKARLARVLASIVAPLLAALLLLATLVATALRWRRQRRMRTRLLHDDGSRDYRATEHFAP